MLLTGPLPTKLPRPQLSLASSATGTGGDIAEDAEDAAPSNAVAASPRGGRLRRRLPALMAAALGAAWLAATAPALARGTADELSTVALASLPPEAQQTKRLILAGGPFPYRKDGSVFFNRERLLPVNARGYYREYTVKTPGASDRGARRIVCGGAMPTAPQACYYTADHYASFSRIVSEH